MFSQLVGALVSPIGVALLLGLLALLVALLGRRRRVTLAHLFDHAGPAPGLAWWLGLLAVGWLWAWSTPLASEALRSHLENQAGPRALQDVAPAQVMVVLGGSTRGPRPPLRPEPDLTSAADRLWHAARLYHAGKAERVVLAGGTVSQGDGSEAQAMQKFLQDMRVPASAMEQENQSHNTASNAQNVAQRLRAQGVDTVLLVTSALHMPRARSWFEHHGLTVRPAPADFEVVPMPMSWLRLLPSTEALHGSARAFKELVGQLSQP